MCSGDCYSVQSPSERESPCCGVLLMASKPGTQALHLGLGHVCVCPFMTCKTPAMCCRGHANRCTSLTEQGAAEVAGMSLCRASPTVAMPRVPREAGSWQPLKYSLLVVSPASTCSSVRSVTHNHTKTLQTRAAHMQRALIIGIPPRAGPCSPLSGIVKMQGAADGCSRLKRTCLVCTSGCGADL